MSAITSVLAVTAVTTGIKMNSCLTPIVVYNGAVTCQSANGTIITVPMPTRTCM